MSKRCAGSTTSHFAHERCVLAVLATLVVLPLMSPATRSAGAQTEGRLVVDVLSPGEPPIRHLDSHYSLAVRRSADAPGRASWEVDLFATPDTLGENLLYHSTEWHGAHPTQVDPVAVAHAEFPSVRALPGYRGAPYVVTLHLIGVTIAGHDTAATFTGGRFEVRWRRVHREPASAALRSIRDSADVLLDRLVGAWMMTGTVRGKPATYRLDVSRVLQRRFVELHMEDVTRPPAYEARVFIGADTVAGHYIAHWLDNFGAAYSVPPATGDARGDTITLDFPYPTGAFHDTFVYDQHSDRWDIRLESRAAADAWRLFAEYRAVRR